MENEKLNCNILVVGDGDIPSVYLTIIQPLMLLQEEHNIRFTVKFAHGIMMSPLSVFDGYDLVIFIRITFMEMFKGGALYCLNKQIPIIYVLDDDLATLYAPREEKYHYGSAIENFFKISTLSIVTTNNLYNKYKEVTNQLKIINGHINLDFFKGLNINKNYTNDTIKIGYASGEHNYPNLKVALPGLVNILNNHPNVSLEIFYKKLPPELSNLKNVTRINPIHDINSYYIFAASRNWGIGIAPLANTEFNRAKSNNKYREYAVLKVPSIYSNIDPYHFITDDGIICNDDGWEQALFDLITHPEKRKKIADAAFDTVTHMYSKETVISTFASIIQYCLSTVK